MKNLLMPIVLGAALVVCGPALAKDDPVQLKLTDLEARMLRIEKIVENQSLIELANQLEQLRSENAALRGEIEKLRYDTDNSASRQRELYVDIDRRLQSLEQAQRSAALAPPPAAAPSQPSPPAPSGRGAAGAAGGATAAAPAPSRPTGTDQQNYKAAFDLLQARHYEEAGKAFSQFLVDFPKSPLADNAQYWLGETQYVQARYKEALAEFQKVIDKYPMATKLPDAMLKVGYCQVELGHRDAARSALQQVMRQFPDTTAARLASQRLEKLSQEGG
jgi:tol-pal system protein YbgF